MSRHIQLLISDEFAEKIILENDSVRLCDDIIDEMDLYSLYRVQAGTFLKLHIFKMTFSGNMQKQARPPIPLLYFYRF